MPLIDMINGLRGPSKALVLAERHARKRGCTLIITQTGKQQADLMTDLELFFPQSELHALTSWQTIPFEPVSPALELQANRIAFLNKVKKNSPGVFVATVDSLLQKTLPVDYVLSHYDEIKVGQKRTVDSVVKQLEFLGYKRARFVESVGEFTAHGAVVDLFPSGVSAPRRLAFGKNRVAELKVFDIETQRTIDTIEHLELLPVRESVLHTVTNRADTSELIGRIKDRGKELETPTREITKLIQDIEATLPVPGLELYSAIAFQLTAPFSYIGGDVTCYLDEPLSLEREAEEYHERVTSRIESLSAEHFLIPRRESLFVSVEEFLQSLHALKHTTINDVRTTAHGKTTTYHTAGLTPLQIQLKTKVGSGKALEPLKHAVDELRRKDFSIAFVVATEGRAERLTEWLASIQIEAISFSEGALEWLQVKKRFPVVIITGSVSRSIELLEHELAIISEEDIFVTKSLRARRKKAMSLKRLMSALAELAPNDYVVHVDYGIGQYCGLKHFSLDGTESDFLHIQYADSTLYLPVHNIGKIHKFSSQEGKEPQLDKLAGTRWAKVKERVKQAAVTLAGDLLRLYATRASSPGWRFDPEGAEDERFAEEFPFDETPDQAKTIHETLADMATDKPMDRLVCGDVGFGKTEIAIRAAFKATQHARQVAVLVPTTILADQHFENFKSRLEPFNIQVGVVSRFYTAKENRETLQKLEQGELQVIVGTHRLLSKDVSFHDLGLMVIDEEHRFGVAHKERLKSLKKQVDSLTLTATPIPRTLHMSLLGIRDISVIATPPADRRTIRTYTAQYETTLVSEAIRRELARGGQIFYLHNQIDDIQSVTMRLQELVPECRFAFAHGQMHEHQLEDIMHRFLRHDIDCLISTTIIESGIDIPNANTIIIERADMFGLAQLYQLRGRVGRSNRQAYAYLLIPKARNISAQARERLQALQSLDELGVGFNLAIRDLEIRGAGNLLGKEQSGSMHSVGFELYTKILKEAIANMQGEELSFEDTIEPDVKLPVEAYVPESYIPDVSERLLMYQRMSALKSPDEAIGLREELEDRYGPIPFEARELLSLMQLRSYIRSLGIISLEYQRGRIYLRFSTKTKLKTEELLGLQKKGQFELRLTGNYGFSFEIEADTAAQSELVHRSVEQILSRLITREVPKPSIQATLH